MTNLSPHILQSLAATQTWIEVGETWQQVGVIPNSVNTIASHIVCALGVNSLHIPLFGLPHTICLYTDPTAPCPLVHGGDGESTMTAKVRVTVTGSDWCRLTYEFGHEFGHVVSNSWGPGWQPDAAHAWLEEACCGALSLLALDRMALRWTAENIFGVPDYGHSFQIYLMDELTNYQKPTALDFGSLNGWWSKNIDLLSAFQRLEQPIKPLAKLMFETFLVDPARWHDMRALNRWSRPPGLSLDKHLCEWEHSCAALGTSGRLPGWCRQGLLGTA